MQKRSLLKIGLVGTVITALCCFTPLLVVVFGAAGLSAWIAGADMVLLPLLAAFILLTGVFIMDGTTPIIELNSQIACPQCGHREMEVMPVNACQWFYDCKGCGAVLRPLPGDCCVFCSYGTVACPPVQEGRGCCD